MRLWGQEFLNKYFLDKYEKEFIKKKKKIILIQFITSHYEFQLIKNLINTKKIDAETEIYALIPKKYYLSPSDYFFNFFFKKISNYLIDLKWKKLYRKIGVKKFIYDINYISYLNPIIFLESIRIYSKIKIRRDVIDLKYKDFYIGDLLYDSYLRYFNKITLKKDFKLLMKIQYSLILFQKIKNQTKLNSIIIYYTHFTNYLNSGIPVRFFLKEKIKVIALGHDLCMYKKLSPLDPKRAPNHLNYRNIFKNLNNKEEKIENGLKILGDRISGINNIKGMRVSSFNKNNIKIKNIEGCVFLHDFYDAQHYYNDILFDDIYQWTVFTLDLIEKYQLPFAIKPHINQISKSEAVIKNLKKKYKNLYWLDSNTSNVEIFKKIKVGFSIFGTVISELAYSNKLAICCGDNPTSQYNFSLRANSIREYKYFLVNYNKLFYNYKPCMKEIGEFSYMHYIYNTIEHNEKHPYLKINRINFTSKNLK